MLGALRRAAATLRGISSASYGPLNTRLQDRRMRTTTRLKAALAATGLFVAGAVAGGLALRPGKSAPLSASAAPPVQVIHKRKVRTIHVKAPRSATATTQSAPPASAAPITSPAPTPVSSRTSPGAGAGGGGDEAGREAERGD